MVQVENLKMTEVDRQLNLTDTEEDDLDIKTTGHGGGGGRRSSEVENVTEHGDTTGETVLN